MAANLASLASSALPTGAASSKGVISTARSGASELSKHKTTGFDDEVVEVQPSSCFGIPIPTCAPLLSCAGFGADNGEVTVEATTDLKDRRRVRMCVYNAVGLPAAVYIPVVLVGDIKEEPTAHEGPEAPISATPVWEFCVDVEARVLSDGGMLENITLQIHENRVLSDRGMLENITLQVHENGASPLKQTRTAALNLASQPTSWPVVKMLTLSSVEENAPVAMVKVAYEILPAVDLQQLDSLAEMDLVEVVQFHAAETSVAQFCVDTRVINVHLQKQAFHTEIFEVHLSLERVGTGETIMDPQVSPQASSTITPNVTPPRYSSVVWGEGSSGWQAERWVIRQPNFHMVGYYLQATVHNVSTGRTVGTWQDTLSNMLEFTKELGHKHVFFAQLHKPNGEVSGELQLEVDVFTHTPHKPIPDLVDGKPPHIRLRRGHVMPVSTGKMNHYQFMVHCDHLIQAGSELRPFIKLQFGKVVDDFTEMLPMEDGSWQQTVTLARKHGEQRVRVQVWNRPEADEEAELLGDVVIRDIVAGQLCWRHMYGGSPFCAHQDKATFMAQGAMRPSTYRGTLALMMKKNPKTSLAMAPLATPVTSSVLMVRLFKGLYLEYFINKRVSISVHLCGTGLPDPSDPYAIAKVTLLKFYGSVDDNGTLRFIDPAEVPRMLEQAHAFSCCGIGKGDYQDEVCHWVQLTTPLDSPLKVPPRVRHAYVYISSLEDDQMGAPIFGRLALGSMWDKRDLKWKTLRFDQSVEQLDEAAYPNDFAGVLLGTATLIPAEKAQALAADMLPSTDGVDQAMMQRRTCWIDVLAGRDLVLPHLAGVGDGECSYEIEVGDVLHRIDDDIPSSPNPTLMHRLAIPFEEELPFGAGQQVPHPPVVFRYFHHKRMIGLVTVKRPQMLSSDEQDVINQEMLAVWRAMDSPARRTFDPKAKQGIDEYWKGRPRWLLAVGFGPFTEHPHREKQEEAPMVKSKIITERTETYQITINVVGLRRLTHLEGKKLRLSISCWDHDGKVRNVDLADGRSSTFSSANPNFEVSAAGHSSAGDRELQDLVARVLEAWVTDADKGMHAIDEQFCGARLVAPSFKASVVPYLQPKHPNEASGEPVVLLPDVVLQILDKKTVCGAISVPMPDKVQESTWAKQALSSWSALPENLQNLSPIKGVALDEDCYTLTVDVFAAKDGWLIWDPDVCMGRALRTQSLFQISAYHPHEDRSVAEGVQYFNPADWMCSETQTEPFDLRVAPTLRCADWDPEKKMWNSTRERKENSMPLGPEQLFDNYLKRRVAAKTSASNTDDTGTPQINTKDELAIASTHQIKWALKDEGYRAVTHSATPELKRTSAPGVSSRKPMQQNLHTFMRVVGHIVDPCDRDSRFLGRLRMALPSRMQESSQGDAAAEMEAGLHNYLVIKFHKPGVVVWASPTCVDSWSGAGEVLFIIHLTDGSGSTVQVLTPSFDLRFPHETVWYLRKTLTRRWRTLENRIKGQPGAAETELEQEQSFGAPKLPRLSDDGKDGKEGKDGKHGNVERKLTVGSSGVLSLAVRGMRAVRRGKHGNDDDKDVDSNGAEIPAYVTKHAFVCRLRKRGSFLYDRAQTQNWYRAVLRKLPEVQAVERHAAPERDLQNVKKFVLEKFMNVHEEMRGGENDHVVGMLKGHVSVHRIDDPKTEAPVMKPICPIDNLWITTNVQVDVYVLTLRGLTPFKKHSGSMKVRPRLELAGVQMAERTLDETIPEGDTGANLYWHASFRTTLPGANELKICIFDTTEEGGDHVLVGASQIDLEDRWLMLPHRQLQQCSSRNYLESHVAPATNLALPAPKTRAVAARMSKGGRIWQDPTLPTTVVLDSDLDKATKDIDGADLILCPHTPPQPPFPVETRSLLYKDESTGLATTVGMLRYCIEITPEGALPAPKYSLDVPQMPFVVSVTIWSVFNISIFRDAGQRNDVSVIGRLLVHDNHGNHVHSDRVTDTHSWAHREANFNWRWTFHVSAPTRACMLAFKLVDKDTYSNDDLIYAPVVLPLDHMLHLAYKNCKMDRPDLGTLFETCVFDEWPADMPEETKFNTRHTMFPLFECCLSFCRIISYYLCMCLTCGRSRRFFPLHHRPDLRPTPALLRVSIDIKPSDGMNAPESERLSEPPGRIGWQTGLNSPLLLLVSAMGQRNVRMACNICCCIGIILAVVIAGLFVVYLAYMRQLFE